MLQIMTATYLMLVIVLTTEGYEEAHTAHYYTNIGDVPIYDNSSY